ncbi:Holliday junction DNA helicase RuvA [Bacillus mesophilus]|uniref:Holliday junction branch migration complex subunit RuvA n=1 Tax=Bacillus mesophilus TaxID=1808955 RepID=A0A6M0Q629_9BACI|nr:Holliday junction branch migration protein RuvA [Bacillus mesophilus]MBM7660681.1 Holliday junction DNA helicase RuvA [Bacillus mesophilus]NEY71772.1 Holliday junction branch migration protein RuvA [Bacillus mesophilus]
MIEFIKGQIVDVNPEYIVIDHQGMGYLIHTPNPYIYEQNQETIIFTYQHVREDILALYGFPTRKDRSLFMKLLNVTGIGPRGALAILAFGRPEQVVSAIEDEDEAFLVKFPGVGKKTARQIILDLKGKVSDVMDTSVAQNATSVQRGNRESNIALEEALEALKVLGYADREIKKVVPHLEKENMTTDQYIKVALLQLVQGK